MTGSSQPWPSARWRRNIGACKIPGQSHEEGKIATKRRKKAQREKRRVAGTVCGGAGLLAHIVPTDFCKSLSCQQLFREQLRKFKAHTGDRRGNDFDSRELPAENRPSILRYRMRAGRPAPHNRPAGYPMRCCGRGRPRPQGRFLPRPGDFEFCKRLSYQPTRSCQNPRAPKTPNALAIESPDYAVNAEAFSLKGDNLPFSALLPLRKMHRAGGPKALQKAGVRGKAWWHDWHHFSEVSEVSDLSPMQNPKAPKTSKWGVPFLMLSPGYPPDLGQVSDNVRGGNPRRAR